VAYGDIALPAGMAGGTISGLFDGGRPRRDSTAAAALLCASCRWPILLNVTGMLRTQPGLPGGCCRQRVSEWLRTVAKMAGLDRFSMHRDSGKNRYRRFQRARAGLHFLQPNLFRVFT
jgi:hypothetical protein